MWAVLASDFLEFFKEFYFVELIVAIGIADPVKAAAAVALVVHDHVEGVESVAGSPRVTDVEIDLLKV